MTSSKKILPNSPTLAFMYLTLCQMVLQRNESSRIFFSQASQPSGKAPDRARQIPSNRTLQAAAWRKR